MSFNWSKFGQSMQKLSQTMLQGTMLYAARDMRGCGGVNHSIWGGGHHCHHTGMYGMYGMGMPSPNIWHPMYSSDTTNPYLIQQGANTAENWGRMMFEQTLAQIQAQDTQATVSTTPDINQDAGKEFWKDLANKGEHTFVTEKWTQLKASATEQDSEKLYTGYYESVSNLGIARLHDINEQYGNNSTDAKDLEKLTSDEFATFAKAKFGDNTPKEKIDLAFDRLDTNDDGSITTDEFTNAYIVMDENNNDFDGKITKDDYKNFVTELTNKDSDIETKLKSPFKENS